VYLQDKSAEELRKRTFGEPVDQRVENEFVAAVRVSGRSVLVFA
jgi:hypothetical protein